MISGALFDKVKGFLGVAAKPVLVDIIDQSPKLFNKIHISNLFICSSLSALQ